MLRPLPARWFEALVAHDDVAAALEALASTGAIELEVHPEARPQVSLAELKAPLDAYADLAQRFRPYWPEPAERAARIRRPAPEIIKHGLVQIRAWSEAVADIIRTVQDLEEEAAELDIWRELFTRFKWSEIEFGLLRREDALLARRMYVFPRDVVFPVPPEVVVQRFVLKNQACVLVLGPAELVVQLDRQAAALKGRRSGLGVPGWLEGRAADNLPRVAERAAAVQASIKRLRRTLDEFNRRYELAHTLADIERLRWFVSHVHQLPGTECFAWLTGWTSDRRGTRLEAALARANVRALLRFPPPPSGTVAPLILENPWWARPFELFARAIGVPAINEVDPSPLLALVVPLLFGYMFGDVGQGVVLFAAGLWLRKRLPIARLFIAGGASATAFGLLFGSVFCREDWIPALWLHPLGAPLTVLGVPLVGGAVLLALGLVLSAVESRWRGELGHWLRIEAGMLLFYVAVLGGLAQPSLFWLAGAGVVWYVAGHALHSRKISALLVGLGSAVEHGFQLAVNTLSFARVGAFALAHAGLSSAIVALADASGNTATAMLIMIVGNAVVIALEGLVVSIQTTRLVLFEFFIRFLRGEGRAFHPLPAPHPPI